MPKSIKWNKCAQRPKKNSKHPFICKIKLCECIKRICFVVCYFYDWSKKICKFYKCSAPIITVKQYNSMPCFQNRLITIDVSSLRLFSGHRCAFTVWRGSIPYHLSLSFFFLNKLSHSTKNVNGMITSKFYFFDSNFWNLSITPNGSDSSCTYTFSTVW